jgi:hypothetical protein
MGKIRIRGGRQCGQTLIIFAIAMPLFLSLVALVADGSSLMVHRRSLQVAADAAALAVAQDLNNPCAPGCLASKAGEYSSKNGGTDHVPACASDSETNCYEWPYVDKNGVSHPGQVEVRLTSHFTGFFASAIGFSNLFGVSARAVAGIGFATSATVITGTTDPGSTDPNVTIPGATHTTTDPGTEVGNGGIAFAMSRRCDAILYQGAGSGDNVVLGALATNGGLTMNGSKPKKVTALYYNASGANACPKPSPDSGTSNCTATPWGNPPPESQNLCVKTLVDLNINNTLPTNWPITPPTPPTPQSGAWDPSTDYPSKCKDLGSSGTITFSAASPPGPPGIYCVTGASTILKVTGNSVDLATGDGYTFFALGGAKINFASNSLKLRFYWPSACGPRPTTRPASFTCFGRTISGYDLQTVLYATNTTYDPANCQNVAICLNGNSNELTGDIFAPKPDVFPPGLTDTGGTVSIEGGALTAGSGFIESWNLTIKGNTGSYSGTGTPITIPGQTHTTTDAETVITGATHPGTTDPGTTQIITTDTNFDLDE